jgi:hypothetical protein
MTPFPRFAASCFKLSAAEAANVAEPVTNVTLTVLAALPGGGGVAAAIVVVAAGG